MSKPIRIVHISSAHKDGDVRIFHKECVSLAEAGFEVYLVIPNTVSRIEKGVHIFSFQTKKQGRFYRTTKIVNRVFEEASKLKGDVYHLHDPELLRISKRFKLQGKKVVYDAHEDLPRQIMSKAYIPGFLRKIISWFTEKYENRKVIKLDGVITATPFIRDRFLKIHNYVVDVNNFPLTSEIELNDEQKKNRDKAICYIGAISSIRGISQLIDACEITKIKLFLAGEMEPGLLESYKNKPGWKYVDYLGQIDRKTSLELKQRCFAGIVPFLSAPNHINAQPNKLFEYMGSGLPVICSDFLLWREIVEKTECGICVDSANPEELAAAILDLSNNPEKVDKMALNGIKVVRNSFNWDVEKQKLILFYKRYSNE